MKVIEVLRSALSRKKRTPPNEVTPIYVFIPQSVQPLERGPRYEDILEEKLTLAGIGHLSGGGSLLGDDPDGEPQIVACGIDVDVSDLSAGRALLRDQLPNLGCPAGTRLEYTEGASKLQDEYDGALWQIGRPRSTLHPGFGV